jgi:hypothetical protein
MVRKRLNSLSIVFSILFLIITSNQYSLAQENNPTVDADVDLSALKNDSLLAELRMLLDSLNKPKSFFSVNLSLSNKLFSAKNNAFNYQQSSTSSVAFMPSISYFNKTGLGLSLTSFFRNNGQQSSFYQTAISPSFDKVNRKLMYGLSYSHYIKSSSTSATPYVNEIYGYFQERKSWVRPSVSFGWANGHYDDVSVIPIRINGNTRLITDTSKVELTDISISAGISHSFSINELFSTNDILSITPQINIIGGKQQFTTTSNRPFPEFKDRNIILDRVRKIYKVPASSTTSNASIQTLATSLNLTYIIKSISISSGYFMGYYFNETPGNRFSHIFNIGLGLTF